MRKLCYFIASSLDGYIARENGAVDFLFTDQDYGYQEFYATVDFVIMGRKTFDQVLTFGQWPYQSKQTVVFTSQPLRSTYQDFENIQATDEDPVSVVQQMKALPGRTIWLVGGHQLASQLLAAQLVDELVLSIHPLTLGSGIPLFPAGANTATAWTLVSSKAYDNGLLQVKYTVARGTPSKETASSTPLQLHSAQSQPQRPHTKPQAPLQQGHGQLLLRDQRCSVEHATGVTVGDAGRHARRLGRRGQYAEAAVCAAQVPCPYQGRPVHGRPSVPGKQRPPHRPANRAPARQLRQHRPVPRPLTLPA